MADSLPSGLPEPEAIDDAHRDARIEYLLVTGLDHYFGGAFESAINLWTRVLFLDRTHDRARAYIVRARTAQAEQQRATEALVHEGLEAFSRGDVERARALLRDALDRGASHDLALGVLGRIDRLDVGHSMSVGPTTMPAPRRVVPRATPIDEPRPKGRRSRRLTWAVVVGVVLLGAGGAWWSLVSGGALPEWARARATPERAVVAPVVVNPLPVPAPTEAYLSRSRTLVADGKLRDALRLLDHVSIGDSLRPEAVRLRGQIQRSLLDLAAAESSDATAAPPPPPVRE